MLRLNLLFACQALTPKLPPQPRAMIALPATNVATLRNSQCRASLAPMEQLKTLVRALKRAQIVQPASNVQLQTLHQQSVQLAGSALRELRHASNAPQAATACAEPPNRSSVCLARTRSVVQPCVLHVRPTIRARRSLCLMEKPPPSNALPELTAGSVNSFALLARKDTNAQRQLSLLRRHAQTVGFPIQHPLLVISVRLDSRAQHLMLSQWLANLEPIVGKANYFANCALRDLLVPSSGSRFCATKDSIRC